MSNIAKENTMSDLKQCRSCGYQHQQAEPLILRCPRCAARSTLSPDETIGWLVGIRLIHRTNSSTKNPMTNNKKPHFAWLIEKTNSKHPAWLAQGCSLWTGNAADAVMFETRQEAEAAAKVLRITGMSAIATEHQFGLAGPTTPASTVEHLMRHGVLGASFAEEPHE